MTKKNGCRTVLVLQQPFLFCYSRERKESDLKSGQSLKTGSVYRENVMDI